MSDASKKILKKLSQSGFRITKARQEVLNVLTKAREPLTIQEMAAKAKADEASVYRTVGLLKKAGFLESINNGEQRRYAVFDHHHHHLICKDCGWVEHVPCDHKLPIPQSANFKEINDHEVNFYGLCRNCA